MMLPPPDIDPGPFEPEAETNRTTLVVVLSLTAAGLIACGLAFAFFR